MLPPDVPLRFIIYKIVDDDITRITMGTERSTKYYCFAEFLWQEGERLEFFGEVYYRPINFLACNELVNTCDIELQEVCDLLRNDSRNWVYICW